MFLVRTRSWLLVGGFALSLFCTACGGGEGGGDVSSESSVASLERIRGEGQPLERLSKGESVVVEGLARLRLDSGPRLLLDSTSLTVTDEYLLTLEGGRAFVDVQQGDSLDIVLGEDTFSIRDASLSLDATTGRVYVVRGEVAHRRGSGEDAARDIIRGGEELVISAAGASHIVPAILWHDWTGGLARPGPGLSEDVAIGALEGRVPGETGQARWPLVIRRLDVRVRVVGDLAITEVDEVFFNPASETVEGLYTIRVPEGAALQRFSVDRNGRMVDGYVREKAQAQAAYQRQVYRGSTLDPALLEWVQPGQYKARIYPIAAGAERRISIRYTEWLERENAGAEDEGTRVYRFPMATSGQAPLIQEMSFEADLSEAGVASVRAGHNAEVEGDIVRLRQSDFRPRADFVLELTDSGSTTRLTAWRATHAAPARAPGAGVFPEDEEDYIYVPLVLPNRLFENVQASGLDVVVVADVSAGTERSELELGRSVVESIAAHLTDADRIAIVASDVGLRTQGGELAELGPADGARVDSLLDRLAREPAGGATDLGATLEEASNLLDPTRSGIVVYVGDGAPTVGEVEAESLLRRVERLAAPLRAYAIAVGGGSSLELLETITRGGGLAARVDTPSAAAEAALRVLAHARRPVAQRVTVELEGAEQVFPRRPVDVVSGGILPIVGRVEEGLAGTVHVRGEIGGQEFDETFELTERVVVDQGDLRLRWAGERLRQLLLSGGRREEIADLGVRYGLITPFTSFYVPSAAEMSSLGDGAQHLYRDAMFAQADLSTRGQLAFAPLLALASMSGCAKSEDAVGTASSEVMPAEVFWDEEQSEGGANAALRAQAADPSMPAAAAPELNEPVVEESERSMNDDPLGGLDLGGPTQGHVANRAVAAPEEALAIRADRTELNDLLNGALVGETEGTGGLGLRGTGREGGGTGEETIGLGNIGTIGHGGGGGSGSGYGSGSGRRRRRATSMRSPAPTARRPRRMENEEDARDEDDRGDGDGFLARQSGLGAGPSTTASITTGSNRNGVTTRIDLSIQHNVRAHQVRYCSDASRLTLSGRKALWGERISAASNASSWVRVYGEASRRCELPRWRDRREMLRLILGRAGNIRAMLQVHRLLSGGSARSFVRRVIFRRVRTPDDIRLVRARFGRSHDAALVTQALERAGEGGSRIRVLRRLILQFPGDIDLKLMLLETLEQENRVPQMMRLARELRADPMTDAGVRTAIGEMLLRVGNEAEARRVFGEIVEFAPTDALARRRLGDLFRAHGWFEDAYRQYQTLRSLTPDDPSVLLLLAQAAAGTGRVNEALGLEQQLAETGAPGGAQGIARTALLWSSVRFAELRKAAREEGDTDALRALAARMRRSGVLRQASALRATLVWSHPEAGLSLFGGYPGLRVTRPVDLSPEFGLEAFDVAEQEDGTYSLEVRRTQARSRRRGHLTEVHAKLVVIWNEGAEGEKVEVIDLVFDGRNHTFAFEIEGQTLRQARAQGGAR